MPKSYLNVKFQQIIFLSYFKIARTLPPSQHDILVSFGRVEDVDLNLALIEKLHFVSA